MFFFVGLYTIHHAYSGLIVMLLFSSILQLVKLFQTQKPIFWSSCANFQTPNSTSFTGFPVKTENHWLYMLIYFQHSARASYCVHFLQRENLGL